MVVSELANDIESRCARDRVVQFSFSHMLPNLDRGPLSDLIYQRAAMVPNASEGKECRSLNERDSGICYKGRKPIIWPQGTDCNLALTERQVPIRSVPTL
jgi:hypothetical protein